MSQDLLLHEKTRLQIASILCKPPHSLLVIGTAGSGKRHVAEHIATQLIGAPYEKLDEQPFFVRLEKPADKKEIPIDSVRQMIKQLALKTSGRKRIVMVENAQLLSEESQNALLKSIEEPPEHTHFILTAPAVTLLLPTITSRSQKITIKPVGIEEAADFFGMDYDRRTITGAWNLSRGGAGLMSALLKADQAHPLKTAVDEAKAFMRMDRYERAVFLDKLSSDKNRYALFLDALDRLLAALAATSIKNGKITQVSRILNSRRLVNKAIGSLTVNSSPRLISLDLAQKLNI
jgi:hypothetical protein